MKIRTPKMYKISTWDYSQMTWQGEKKVQIKYDEENRNRVKYNYPKYIQTSKNIRIITWYKLSLIRVNQIYIV